MLWAAAASLLAAPAPHAGWFTPSDVLADVVPPERPMFVGIRVTVTPSGRVRSCEVEASSGSKRLDEHMCDLTRRRARFRPARWIDGTPAWGVYRQSIRYLATESPWRGATLLPGDLLLRLNRVPRSVRSPYSAEVALAVDARGEIQSCEALDEKQHPRLVALGCDQLLKSFKAVPARDGFGIPTRSVQTARINFTSEPVRSTRRPLKAEAAAPFGTAAPVSS